MFQNASAIGKAGTEPVEAKHLSRYAGKLMVNNMEPAFARGLLFCTYIPGTKTVKPISIGKLRIYTDAERQAINLNAKNLAIVIPNLKAGQTVIVGCRSVTSPNPRYLDAHNLDVEEGFGNAAANNLQEQTCIGKVAEDGDVAITSSNGIYVYSITIKDKDGNTLPTSIGHTTLTRRPNNPNIYSLNGHYLGTNIDKLPKGLYIRNGKKIGRL